MKGRVACEISTCECLIATEAIFQGLFSDLTPPAALSLLCCLVNQNKVAEASFGHVPATLKAAVEDLSSVVRTLGELQREAGLTDIDPEDYLKANVRPSMTEVRHASPLYHLSSPTLSVDLLLVPEQNENVHHQDAVTIMATCGL